MLLGLRRVAQSVDARAVTRATGALLLLSLPVLVAENAGCSARYLGPRCSAPLVACGEICVDPKNDRNHCGSCEARCTADEICTDHGCELFCGPGATLCGDRCVETAFNPQSCGACGIACGPDDVCSNGTCSGECAGGTTRCGSRCADLQVDRTACGSCDNACGDAQVCFSGRCLDDCPPTFTKCGNRCVDVQSDPKHCGGCASACEPGRLCSGAQCVDECRGGTIACDFRCVDSKWDPQNCGECAKVCGPGELCSLGACDVKCSGGTRQCGMRCADTRWDPANCGECGTVCGAGQVCSEGACRDTCTGGTARCGHLCVFLGIDPEHCGKCFQACGPEQMCTGAECVAECPPDTTQCGAECANTDFHPDHCGGCGRPCGEGMVCWRAACLTPTLSGATGSWSEQQKNEGPAELPAITDFTPASNDFFFAGAGSTFFRFGSVWESLAAPDEAPFPPNAGIAWVGKSLYFVRDRALFGFDLGAMPGRWVREAELPASTAFGTQVTHDDDGALYFLSGDGRIVRYAPVSGEAAVDPQRIGSEPPWRPRLAWDSLTRRLYVAPRFDRRSFFEYDPKSKRVLELPGPVNDAIGSAFCSDRGGHIYTAGDDGLDAWQYTVWTQGWTRLPDVPVSLHPGAACTVIERAFLYFYRPQEVIRIELR